MRTNNRKIIIVSLLLIAGVAAFFGVRSYIFSRIHTAIDEKIQSLNESGFKAHYDTLSIHWGRNVIEVSNLSLEKTTSDTSCVSPERISIANVRAEGFALMPLLFRNVLRFDDFYLDKMKVVLRQNSQLNPEVSTKREKDFTLSIGRSFFRSVEFAYTDSMNCEMISGVQTDLTIDGLTLEFLLDQPFNYQVEWVTLNRTEIDLPKELYKISIAKLRWDFLKEILIADSLEVLPTADKIEFGRKRGFEIDRYEAVVPYFEATDFSVSMIDTAAVTASMAEIQFYLKVFRDKRQPFVNKEKLLPVAQLRDLGFALHIDSMKVIKSYVQYEEFAEEATEPGKVYFDNLYASLYNIDNRATTGDMKLNAQANLLGQGSLNLFVNFPLEKDRRSRLVGSIADFNLPEINAMLIPSTNLKVESGNMKNLTFTFSFSEIRSDGSIELNYEDLKLSIFKDEPKEEGGEPEKDNLKTFIMNTFIFKTNMDEDVPEEKRTGTVAFVRDNTRSVFNFWVKSLVSGIKSAYNLDKTEAKKTEREIKKEERLAKREARKIKRAEKKKERG